MRLPPQFAAHLWLSKAGVRGQLPLGRGSHVNIGHLPRVLLAVDVQIELGGHLVGAVREDRVEEGRSPSPQNF